MADPAQFLSPRRASAWTAIIGFIWYGFWLVAAIAAARLRSRSRESGSAAQPRLPGGLLLVFLYWQVVPLLMAATGASLDLRKLQAYPIPVAQLFAIEVMLRVTAADRDVPDPAGRRGGHPVQSPAAELGALAMVPYMLFNLLLAVGVRDLVARLLARKRIREIAFLALVMCAGAAAVAAGCAAPWAAGLRAFCCAAISWTGWPWTAAANLAQGREVGMSLGVSCWPGA